MLKHRRVDSITQINKSLRKAKKESSQDTVTNLGKPNAYKIIASSDASYTNLRAAGFQGWGLFCW